MMTPLFPIRLGRMRLAPTRWVTDRQAARRRWATSMIACGHLVLGASCFLGTGCQSPLRFWRKDEPTIEQLLAAPQPWDAETKQQQQRAGSNLAKSTAASPATGAKDKNGAPSANAKSSGFNSSQNDPQIEEFSEEELEATLAEAPPHLRPLIQRQWEASRAHAIAQKSQGSQSSLSRNASPSASRDSSRAGDIRLAQLSPKGDSARKPSTSEVASSEVAGASVYRLSDLDEGDENGELDEFPMPKPSVSTKPRASKELAAGSVHRSLRDANSDGALANDNEDVDVNSSPAEAMRKMVQDVPPPRSKKSARQIPHAAAKDTGADDESLALMAVRSQRQPNDGALAAAASSRQSADGMVAPATAEGKASSTEATVVPASASGSATKSSTASNAITSSQAASSGPPAPTTAIESARLTLRLLEEESQKASGESPAQQLHRQAFQRMLHLFVGELDPALKPIDGLQSHEQEFFRHQWQSLYNATDPKGNPDLSRRWALVMENERQAMTHLAAVSSLEVKNAAFCTNVDGFAAITKFPTTQFKAGGELLLYCEVDNFVSEQVKDGFETKLQGSYDIIDANGARIADVLLPQEVDICKRPRRDYFFVYRIYMPQTIAPGRYQLRLTIEDMKGRKFGQSTLDFQVVAS